MAATAPVIELVQYQLEVYRRTGRPLHLVHAARALKEALALAAIAPAAGETADVGASDRGR